LTFTKAFRLINPVFLLGGLLMYTLGVGISHYLGFPLDWMAYLLGEVCVICLQLGTIFLNHYFKNVQLIVNRGPLSISKNIRPAKLAEEVTQNQNLLMIALTNLTLVAILVALIINSGHSTSGLMVILFFTLLLAFFYAVPPFRLANSGYGELIISIFMSNIIPLLAFQLQTGNIHRLVALATFPLTPLYLAIGLATEFKDYMTDIKSGHITLLTSLGWQRGMTYHNLLILIGFILFGVSIFLGLPFRIGWVALLSLPVGLFQIWQMGRIAGGMKPQWRLLSSTAIATFGLMSYLLMFSFWLG
jgi:1,4-dihydroxy-2-naphthoate octaprenyltransferase